MLPIKKEFEEPHPVTLFMEGPRNGCGFYRIFQPYSYLLKNSPFPVAGSLDLSQDDLELWIDKADVIVLHTPTGEKFLDFMIENKGKKKFIIDSDDHMFAVNPYNPSYEKHGFKEVDFELPDGTKIEVRDGKNGFDLRANRERLLIFGECLKRADLITTPSSILSGFYKKFNRKTKVIKNFLDFNVWKPLPLVKDEFIRIGWQGGWSHYPDFAEFMPEVLAKVMDKHKNVKFVVMGCHFSGITKNLPQDRIEVHEWTSMETYPWKFKTLGIDIGICPLVNNEFNASKSELKWEEYSSLGDIVTVAQNQPPYNLSISHAETGLLCRGIDDWVQSLEDLIENKDYRLKLAKQAQEKVRQDYDISKEWIQYKDAIKSIFKPELVIV